jgi:endonuclease YncB( thermonuclease family)
VSRVIDGDTLVLRNGARVRLVQIDAPESGGECHAAALPSFEGRPGPGNRTSGWANQDLKWAQQSADQGGL